MAERHKHKIIVNNQAPYEMVAPAKVQRTNSLLGSSRTNYKRRAATVIRKEAVEDEHDLAASTQSSLSEVEMAITTSATAENKEASVGCHKFKIKFDDEVKYMNIVTSHSAVAPVDDDFWAFVIQDVDLKRNCLKDEFYIVQRCIVKVPDGYLWLFGCSCNPGRQQLIDGINHTLSETPETDFDKPFEKCLHVKVMEQLVAGFTETLDTHDLNEFEKRLRYMRDDIGEHSYDKHQPKVSMYSLDKNDHMVVVRWEEMGQAPSYNIIKVDFRGPTPVLKCSTCFLKGLTTSCKHVDAIFNQGHGIGDNSTRLTTLLNEKPKWRSRYVPVPVSSRKIPFSPPPEHQKRNRRDFSHMLSEDGYICLKPYAVGACECGNEWPEAQDFEETFVVLYSDILPVKVYTTSCNQCNNLKDYDGAEDQLLNMGLYVVEHNVFRQYLHQFVTEGTTLMSYYQELCWKQAESGNIDFQTRFPYNRFRYAWYGFLGLLDIDYNCGFSCPECGETPETVVMDGVALGLKKSFLSWSNFMKSKSVSQTFDGSSHNMRVFINNAQTRTLMLSFCKEGLGQWDFRHLQNNIKQYQPALSPLLEEIDGTEGILKCPEMLLPLLKILSSNYPVCAFLHYNTRVFEILQDIASGNNISERLSNTILLKQECPVLANVIQQFNWICPIYFRPLILELLAKAKSPFTREVHTLPNCESSCKCTENAFFPSLTKQCHRGEYVLDSKVNATFGGCRKRGSAHPSLSPGIFTVSCVHGVCYGFQMMEDVESPNIPFTILRTLFAKAPKLIIYDNACNLHSYCLNRDPTFFKDSWFVVDRFHWVNHVGCHIGYNLSLYIQFKNVNTQVAEQRNSTLKKLKSMLSYMNVENFTNHLKLFIWFRSMLSLLKRNPTMATTYSEIFLTLLPVYSRLK